MTCCLSNQAVDANVFIARAMAAPHYILPPSTLLILHLTPALSLASHPSMTMTFPKRLSQSASLSPRCTYGLTQEFEIAALHLDSGWENGGSCSIITIPPAKSMLDNPITLFILVNYQCFAVGERERVGLQNSIRTPPKTHLS